MTKSTSFWSMAAKPFVFATLMVLNIHVSQNVGFADSLKISVSTAHACPDEVDDCIVVTPDENDKIDTGSGGGGFVFDGGSGAGGGSVGSGNGGGSSGGSDNSLGKSEQEIEACKSALDKVKTACIRNANLRLVANNRDMCDHLRDFSVTILGVTVHFNEKTDCLTNNRNIMRTDISVCNANFSRDVANVCH